MRARRAHMGWLGAIPKQPRKGKHFLRKFRVANNGENPRCICLRIHTLIDFKKSKGNLNEI